MEGVITGPVAPRSVEPGRGIAWWTEAWTLFLRNPGLWIVLALVLFVVLAVLSVIPLLGALAAALLAPVFLGGWLLAARKVDGGGTLEINDLFAGFKAPLLTPLVIVGLLLAVVLAVLGWLMGLLGFGAVFGVMMGGMQHGMGGAMGGLMAGMGVGLVGLLVALVLVFVVGMAVWFAPALVVLKGLAPVDAIKVSFAASLKNLLAYLLFALVYLVAAFVASLLFGLGWIVLIPLLLLTAYTSSKDVFAA